MCEALDKPCVLFADDYPDTLDMLAKAAELRGWGYDTARTPQEIISKVEAHCAGSQKCYDALVLDINYEGQQPGPRETGISITRALRRKFPNLPIIFITAFDTRMMREEALKVGNEIISKPLDPMYVLDRVEIWMRWASRRKKYEGPERRSLGMNRSGQYRRATDNPIEINPRLREAIEEVRAKYAG